MSTEAFQVLLGTKGDDAQTIDALISGQGNDGMQFHYLFSVETTAKMHESVRANLRDKIFNGSQQSLDRFLLWRTFHVQKAWRTLLEGHGEIWRRDHEQERVTTLFPGVAIDIPVGTALTDLLRFICVTMPRWRGDQESTYVVVAVYKSDALLKRPVK